MEEQFVPDLELREQRIARNAVLDSIDGHMRWIVTREDGSKYALRPESAKNNETQNKD